jgi:hypothetical protein
MDLSSLLATDTAVITIKHPKTGMSIPGMTVTVAGNASEEYRRVRAELAKRRLESTRSVTVDELEAAALTLLVSCVRGWTGFERDGAEVECTPANVRELVGTPGYFWLKEQIEAGVGDTANFIAG